MLRQWLGDPETIPPFAAQRPPSSSSPGGSPVKVASSSGGRVAGAAADGGERADPVPSFDLNPTAVVEGHSLAQQASEATKRGELDEAIKSHLAASHLFLEAAERLQDNEVTGSALLLLSDGHARQAYTLQLARQRGEGGEEVGRSGGGAAAVAARKVGPVRKAELGPPPPGPPGGPVVFPDGSMYSSAMGPGNERPWTTQVDDMLALERQLQALGVQPMMHASGYQAVSGGNPSGRYLSSTLGESFFVVSNRNAAAREGALGGDGGAGLSASSLRGSKVMSKRQQAEAGGGTMSSSRMRDRSGLPPDGRPTQGMVRGGAAGAGAMRGGPVSGSLLRVQQQPQPQQGGEHKDNPGGQEPPPPPPQQPSSMHQQQHPPSHRRASGEGSFLDSVGPVHQGEVMRLLEAMQTLGEENAILIKQVEESMRVRRENEKLKRDMADFKELYTSKFNRLRTALEEFRQKYAHEMNPANHLTSTADKARIESLEAENQKLYARLNLEKEAHRKKDLTIKRYEQWYKTLRANAQSKHRMLMGQQGPAGGGTMPTATATNARAPPPLTPMQQQIMLQQQAQQLQHQQAAGLRAPSSSSSASAAAATTTATTTRTPPPRREGPPLRGP